MVCVSRKEMGKNQNLPQLAQINRILTYYFTVYKEKAKDMSNPNLRSSDIGFRQSVKVCYI